MSDDKKLSCSEVKELISPLCDRELSTEEREIVKEHLETCQDCAFTSSMMVGIKRILGHWEGVKASATFRTKVMESIAHEPSWQERHRRNIITGIVLSAVALLAIVLYYGLRPSSNSTSPKPVDVGENIMEDTNKPAGGIVLHENTVKLSRSGGSSSLATEQDIINTGTTISTEQNSRVELRLNEGFRLALSEKSAVKFLSTNKIEIKSGRIFCEHLMTARGSLEIVFGARRCILGDKHASVDITKLSSGDVIVRAGAGSFALNSKGGDLLLNAGLEARFGGDGTHLDGPSRADDEDLLKLNRWSELK